jgi:23S rRNA (cytidine1920-2'-O)/16S rRNA (cytidine1409-2'-O)-methyltransferase
MIPKLKEMPNLTDLICLIKPQFECGKEIADKYHGVIKDKKVHEQVLTKMIGCFQENGFYLQNLTFSPIQGGSGNIEYLAHFVINGLSKQFDINQTIIDAFCQTK